MITKQKSQELSAIVFVVKKYIRRLYSYKSSSLQQFVLLTGLIILLSFRGFSQEGQTELKQKNYFSISANYAKGTILPTNDFVRGDNLIGAPLKKYEAYSLKLLWQNPGYTEWQKIYHVPYYGAGLTVANFHNPTEIGNPVSAYGILGIPVIRLNKLEVFTEFQFGIASNWKCYDSISNPKNKAIGGSLTVHTNLGLNAFYSITKNLDLCAGLNFSHFSNGGFERPNRGFNIYSPSVEMKYHFGGRPATRGIPSPGRLDRSNDLYLMMGYGDHQLVEHELDTNYFAVGGLSSIYFHQFSNAFRLGAGTDLNYWWGLNVNPDGTIGPRTWENFTVGLIVQPELIIDRLTLVGGIGIYARHLHYGSFYKPYQRLGVRYDIYKNWSLGVNVRSVNFMLAEFLEFNIGYRFRWMK